MAQGCAKRIEPFRPGDRNVGYASWYGHEFNGRKTASGEKYNMYDFTAAHRTAPFGTRLQVTNLDNGKATTVRVNDRGPFVKGRLIDLSLAAAKAIDLIKTGTAKVQLLVVGQDVKPKDPAPPVGNYFLQLGSFKDEENARNFQSQLRDNDPTLALKIVHEEDFYKVWAGPYPSDATASAAQNQLKQKGHDTLILRRED